MKKLGRYVIVLAPDHWQVGDPLPDPRPDDLWFDRLGDFMAAMNAPWDQMPIDWTATARRSAKASLKKPCPRCGGSDVTTLKEIELGKDRVVVVCEKCFYRWHLVMPARETA